MGYSFYRKTKQKELDNFVPRMDEAGSGVKRWGNNLGLFFLLQKGNCFSTSRQKSDMGGYNNLTDGKQADSSRQKMNLFFNCGVIFRSPPEPHMFQNLVSYSRAVHDAPSLNLLLN